MSAGDGISGAANAPRPGQNGTRRLLLCVTLWSDAGSYDANAGGGIVESTGDCARVNALADPLRGREADVVGTGATRGASAVLNLGGGNGGGEALRGPPSSSEDDELGLGGGELGLLLRTHLSDLPMTLPRLRPPALPSAALERKAVGGERGWDCEGRRLEGFGERRSSRS